MFFRFYICHQKVLGVFELSSADLPVLYDSSPETLTSFDKFLPDPDLSPDF
jgi:hypothetical protein